MRLDNDRVTYLLRPIPPTGEVKTKIHPDFKSFLVGVLILWIGISVKVILPLLLLILFGERATGQQSCASIAGTLSPPIGTACVERVFIKSGKADWPDEKTKNVEQYTPPNYWLITYVSPLRETSAQQSNANRQIIQGGQLSRVTRQIDDLYKSSLDAYNKVKKEATIPTKGGVPVNIKGMLENIEREMREVRQVQNYLSNVNSNVGQVILTAQAWGKCKWRIPLSSRCGDGTGGWYSGYVDVTRVYVGNVQELERQLQKNVARTYQALRQVKGRSIVFHNRCRYPVKLAMRYRQPSGEWTTNGWWNFAAGKRSYLTHNKVRIGSNNSVFYYYAQITQKPHRNYKWSGNENRKFSGRTLPMKKTKLPLESNGNYELSISCNNITT
ncbi:MULTISPECIES: DUF1036 domain-containing protein [Cyanophyceae]|uniref:DUF1036 domain-containing protein n=2 Tax=Cyanobacteriota TaxID=1117 RepID=UPI00232EAEFA|nr:MULTISPECIES: DUF1036 domain-containing protein [Cyanophyceae]MDB9356386.1 DUF1036 domain-containing protein [Nodularia spumigena CS-587/03]MDB9316966.1 DUF1036 domain-containing protein [Nodularia spumigena CS-590/01A]MDB9328046.1 DUF1036 domain-containing protein [Nodularia spumigena CS-590/02]MDB9335239.1 DUF1036 domain-containing protein [Nodularia spumigena CS-590/01]MDB9341226.1 DUF1036 domain-containing protein [Nodularia spumigena CS-589/07]